MFEVIKVEDISDKIKESYFLDSYFIDTYHLKNPTIESCINDSLQTLNETKELYIIQKEDKTVCFFGKAFKEDNEFILPLFIYPEFRKDKEIILEKILSKFSKPLILLSLKNKRAIKFFINNNFTMIGIVPDDGNKDGNGILLKKR